MSDWFWRRTLLMAIAACASAGLACTDPLEIEHFDVSAESPTPEPPRPKCRDRAPLRNAYFGDLHVHTGLSSDALGLCPVFKGIATGRTSFSGG